MRTRLSLILVSGLLLPWAHASHAFESEILEPPGLKSIRLLSEVSAVVPGETLTIGLLLDPLPSHHTYWKGPGIVGVATRMDWTLPEGFKIGETIWPPPSQVLMAGIVANGYKTPVLLLTEIEIPIEIGSTEVTFAARCSWMACSTSCNPGIADLGITLPVVPAGSSVKHDGAISKRFAETRRSAPKPAPANWSFTPHLPAPDRIELEIVIPEFDPVAAPTLHFFCNDMQVDSDEPQQFTVTDPSKGVLRITLARPEFAPNNPEVISGVLFHPAGWPGLGTDYIEFTARWPTGTFPHE